jgi:hypothetical protein
MAARGANVRQYGLHAQQSLIGQGIDFAPRCRAKREQKWKWERLEAFPQEEMADFVGSAQGHLLLSEDIGNRNFPESDVHAATNVAATYFVI